MPLPHVGFPQVGFFWCCGIGCSYLQGGVLSSCVACAKRFSSMPLLSVGVVLASSSHARTILIFLVACVKHTNWKPNKLLLIDLK